jgi:hypothetical protein
MMSFLAATTRLTFGKMDLRRIARLTSWIAVAGTFALAALVVAAFTIVPAHSWLPTVGFVAWIVSCSSLYVSMRAESVVIVAGIGRAEDAETTARADRPVIFRKPTRTFPLSLRVTSRFPLTACTAKTGHL